MKNAMLVIDAACDVSDAWIAQHGVAVLPFRIRTGDYYVEESRNENRILRSYGDHLILRNEAYAESVPMPAAEIEQFFHENVTPHCDKAIMMTIASQRSQLNQQAETAWFNIVTGGYDDRKESGRRGSFELKIFDTSTIGPGQAVLAKVAMAQLNEGHSLNEVMLRLDKLRKRTFAFCLPSDLRYLHTRAKAKNEKSISFGRYLLGNALNVKPILRFHNGVTEIPVKIRTFEAGAARLFSHLISQIERGLLAPYVSLSYSGLLTDISQMPMYAEVLAAAKRHNVEVELVPMSLTVAVNLGAGALTLAYIATDAELQ